MTFVGDQLTVGRQVSWSHAGQGQVDRPIATYGIYAVIKTTNCGTQTDGVIVPQATLMRNMIDRLYRLTITNKHI